MEDKILTACVCFHNEGEEVEATVKSILGTTSFVRVVLVDDFSNDGVDYKSVAEEFGCDYHRMERRSGSVGVKDWAGRNAGTEYFVLLDGHMRFYESGWDERIIKLLDKYPKSIISSRTIYRKIICGEAKETNGLDLQSFCASLRFDGGFDFDPKWTDKVLNYNDDDKVSDVACVLGACYATSKTWWDYIGGLRGLTIYGLEESLMSVKTWLLGGSCKVTHDWGAGHLYRKVNPNGILTTDIDANRLFLAYLFNANPTLVSCNLYKRLGMFVYGNAMNTFANRIAEYQTLKEDFERKRQKDFKWFVENINNQVVQ